MPERWNDCARLVRPALGWAVVLLSADVLIINFWKRYGLRVIAVTTENSVPPNQLKPLAAVLEVPLAKRFKGGPYGRVPATGSSSTTSTVR